jgi:hypothetical protein
MSAVTSSNAASGAVTGTPRRTYVTINGFNEFFYSYTTSTDFTGGQFVTTGSLNTVSGANGTTCPAGRILRENGKRLYPGVNPGVSSMLVGVFDDKTFLNGFIDPNAKVFQTQNNDIAPSYPDQVDTDCVGTRDLGNGVYTRGDLRAEGNLDLSGSAIIGDTLVVDHTSYLKGDVITYQSTFVHAPIRIGDTGSFITRVKFGSTDTDFGTAGQNTTTVFQFELSTSACFNPTSSIITVNAPDTLQAQLIYSGAYLSGTSTCNVRLYNTSGSGVNVAAGTYKWILQSASSF